MSKIVKKIGNLSKKKTKKEIEEEILLKNQTIDILDVANNTPLAVDMASLPHSALVETAVLGTAVATDAAVATTTVTTATALTIPTWAYLAGGIAVAGGVLAAGGGSGGSSTLLVAPNKVAVVDTLAPTVVSASLADNELVVGENTQFTLVFSEAVTNFDNTDLTIENGTLNNMTTTDNITWNAIFTPNKNINSTTNSIDISNNYTDISGNSGVGHSSDNYGVSTVDLSFYAWNGLTGYDTVQKNISDKNLTVYLNADSEFNTNAQTLESDGATVWMFVSQNPTTKMIDNWINQILDYNTHGGKILGLSLDVEPWVNFADQNDPANKDEWQNFLDFVSYVSQSVHENNLELSISMPFWLDSINNDVFPNNRPIIYDIIDISDEVIIMDYTTNQTNFVNFASNELLYADSTGKSIKLAIETTDLGDDNLSFYNNPQAMIPFLQTSFSNQSFDGYAIHAMDTFATLNPAIVL